MKNPIYENKEDLEFIEENLDELLKSIGSAAHVNEYYIDVFKHEKPVFNLEAFIWGGWWFGYRKMHLEIFLISLIVALVSTTIGILLINTEMLQDLYYALNGSMLALIQGILNLIIGLVLAQYANYIYFRRLKKRIIYKKRQKYGKSVAAAFGGIALSIVGGALGGGIVGGIAGFLGMLV